ncbi:MAG: hypothetical protein KJP09_01540 [Bacteroidia bacterium]|nr:hypothetical protein [Bacteroidia bacterium]MBT8309815.1 hypothetical protein [Bacteroidia bacterium]NND10312.1 hypothetical protein [Flavobacteriaceae bacterium]NNK26629.1 hypothetical protein [Flavobacteriaceae bacterium]NNL60215.1 hypothetical protein [Flavobacteriaceae bacterium]
MGNPIENPYYNIFIIFICGVIFWVASINSIKFSAQTGVFVYIYLPLISAAMVMVLYLLSRLLIKRYSWIITLVGGLALLTAGIATYFNYL